MFVPARRYADIATMNPDLREVKLAYAPAATSMEYAIHGRFKKPPVNGIELGNGVWGCWYMTLKQLVLDLNKEDTTELLKQFESDLAEAREDAINGIDLDNLEEDDDE